MQKHIECSPKALLEEQLNQNQNPQGYKQIIHKAVAMKEERVYYYVTGSHSDYMKIYLQQQNPNTVLRDRIAQITQTSFKEIQFMIHAGTLTKELTEPTEEEETMLRLSRMMNERAEELIVDVIRPFGEQSTNAKDGKNRVKKIREESQVFKDRIAEQKQMNKEKQMLKDRLQAEMAEQLKQEQLVKNHQKIKQKLHKIEEKKKEREENNKKFHSFLKEYKSTKPLHKLMEDEYREKVELPFLEEKKKKFHEMLTERHRANPTLEEINEHERKLMEKISEREEKVFCVSHTIDVPYKSSFYINEKEKMRYTNQESEIEEQMQKKKRYSEYVKDTYVPTISRKLLKKSREKVRESTVSPHLSTSMNRKERFEVGNLYLQYVKVLEKKKEQPVVVGEVEKTPRYLDYLKQQKQKREQHQVRKDWEQDLSESNVESDIIQKRRQILMRSRLLEEKAEMDQRLLVNNSDKKAQYLVDIGKEIDEKLVEAAHAKMALLKDYEKRLGTGKAQRKSSADPFNF